MKFKEESIIPLHEQRMVLSTAGEETMKDNVESVIHMVIIARRKQQRKWKEPRRKLNKLKRTNKNPKKKRSNKKPKKKLKRLLLKLSQKASIPLSPRPFKSMKPKMALKLKPRRPNPPPRK